MESIIGKYAIISYVKQTIRHERLIKEMDRGRIIASTWRMVYLNGLRGHVTDIRPEKMLAELKRIYSDRMKMQFGTRISISLPNSNWSIIKDEKGYRIGTGSCNITEFINCHHNASLTAQYIYSFDQMIPVIHEAIDEFIIEEKKNMSIIEIYSATAEAMIKDMIDNGLISMPSNYTVKATRDGRIKICLNHRTSVITCPMDYLKARLVRRFGVK